MDSELHLSDISEIMWSTHSFTAGSNFLMYLNVKMNGMVRLRYLLLSVECLVIVSSMFLPNIVISECDKSIS